MLKCNHVQWSARLDEAKTMRNALYYRLVEEVEEKLTEGQHTGSYVEDLLKNREELGISRDQIV